ncbi:MAG: hypothetical protein MAG715_00499 [Methanonatronarchaeales archaeon]|nr:hypothetical protein [Methanonatronarchaeales archaeon]
MRLWKAIVALLFVAALVSSAHSVRVEETPLLDEWSDVAGVPAGKTEGGKTPTPLPGESRTSTPAPTPTPAPTGAVEGGSVSSSGTEEYLDKSFDWRFGGREWSLSLGIPEDAYRYYRDKPRPRTGDYSVY